jgi:hypothetical protein
MEVRTVDGVDFLLVEKGGFGSIDDAEAKPAGPDWHCGYQGLRSRRRHGRRREEEVEPARPDIPTTRSAPTVFCRLGLW